jgi:hypothetical protein
VISTVDTMQIHTLNPILADTLKPAILAFLMTGYNGMTSNVVGLPSKKIPLVRGDGYDLLCKVGHRFPLATQLLGALHPNSQI